MLCRLEGTKNFHCNKETMKLATRGITAHLLLMCHNVEDHAVGFLHALGTYKGEVADATVHIIFDKTFHVGNELVLYGKHGAQYGS